VENATEEQAAEIFNSINTNELTEEDKAQITEAVQNAPEEIRNVFEEEINIYADGFDDYVPVGSNIDVGTRRTLLAATTVLMSSMGVAASGGGSNGGSGGPSGRNNGGNKPDGSSRYGRKEDEPEDGEDEEFPGIEGPGDDEDGNYSRNSIFKYKEGTMEKRFSPWGFIKKFARETATLAFTISGTVIVFATLSGETRKITVIATLCAFGVHYLHAMLKNDQD